MKNFYQEGENITWTNGTGSAVVSGQVVAIGSLVGIACVDIASTTTGAVKLEGVFLVPKTAGTAWTQGAELNWDASAATFDIGTATPATGDISGCCVAAYAAASAATTGYVLINKGVGTIT
jgi:predicted RecA/RadA family phage recombinase